jgi:uncharacterized protein YprB with RNaseH-like and TPR domain
VLLNTFCHIPGIGQKTERRFWEQGLRCWDDFIETHSLRLPPGRAHVIRQDLERSRRHLAARPRFFADRLATDQHWRIFPHFRDRTAFIDIETTGLDGWDSHITTIALYDGRSVSSYVYGENLEQFLEDISRYEVLVTYNGKCFDVPFIESYFSVRLDQVHIDLRYVLKRLGYSGGLKGCERQMGLHRGELDGVDGYFAVLLWHAYQRAGSREALETLLAYNILDTVNLEHLMVAAYNLNLKETPFAQSHRLPVPSPPELPFSPDPGIIQRIRASLSP